jgi:hypothetical protein
MVGRCIGVEQGDTMTPDDWKMVLKNLGNVAFVLALGVVIIFLMAMFV